MTDKEKLLGGIKLIQSACHNSPFIVEDFKDEDFTKLKKAVFFITCFKSIFYDCRWL